MTTANALTPPGPSPLPEPKTDTQTALLFPTINDRLGSLRIIEPIAAGGMAVVYKVKHEELEVVRAAKVLKPGFTEETRQRLFTEAKISANLHHPNIVQIYNVALWKSAVPYIEMEYVHGTPLKDLIAHHTRLPFLVASAIASIVCRALSFAHQQSYSVYGKTYHGLVHRDIKPANILIAGDGTVKLADFGIALPGFESIHTADSVIMGTSPYLSPEQIRGEKLDHRSDIYSLGVVLYEMLTGIKTFPQPIMPGLMHAKLKGKYNSIRSLAPEVPNAVASIVDKSIMADKDKRYADAASLGEALDKAIRQFTDEPPSQIVKDFVEGTRSEKLPAVTTQRRLSDNTRFFLSLAASLVLMTGLLAGALLLFDRYSQRKDRGATQVTFAVQPAASSTLSAPQPPPATGDAKPEGAVAAPRPADVPPPQSRRLSLASTPAPRMQETAESATRPVEAVPAAGREQPPDPPAAPSARFAQGRQKFVDGAFQDAEDLLQSARRDDVTEGSPEWIDITYYWALNRSALHDRKPNGENRRRAREAWEEFTRTACSGYRDDARCGEAREKAAALVR